MARSKSPYRDFERMPPLPKPLKPHHRRSDDDDDYEDDDGYGTREELINEVRAKRQREEEERQRAYDESPEGIADRKRIVNRKKYFWDAVLTIWVYRPIELMKYLFNTLFKKQQRNKIRIGHFISVVLWIIILWISIEIYLSWGKIAFSSDYIIKRIFLLGMIVAIVYLYCEIKSWWKSRNSF
jgi:hypothetical protein